MLVYAPPATAQDAPWTLDAFVGAVLDQGLDARAAQAEVDVAEAEREAVGLWPNPSIGASREHALTGARAGESQDELYASIPLVLSGRLGLLRDAAERDVDAARARVAHARGGLRREATAAWLVAVAARARIDEERRTLIALDEIVRVIVAREEAGEAAGYDRVRIELEKRRMESDLAIAIADEAAARSALEALLPAAKGDLRLADADLSDALVPPSPTTTVDERGDLRALTFEVQAAQAQEDAAWRAMVPDPRLFGGGVLQDVGQAGVGAGYAVGIEVPLPFFDRGQGDGARARARRTRAQAQRAATLHAARARLDAALAARAARIERSRRHDEDVVGRADELMTITTGAYRGGAAELLAVVDAQRIRREARLASIDLRLQARLAESDALFLAGAYDAPGTTP